MRWDDVARIWPNRDASRFVDCRPHRWHVQEMGEGPLILLLHGAGGATHSWRGLMPALARSHRVAAIDLPGQGLTRQGSRARAGLVPCAEDIAALAASQGWQIAAIVGHSAGAALGLQLARILQPPPRAVIGLNAALESFPGPAEWAFPMLAKLLSANPLTATIAASTIGSRGSVAALVRSTGSRLDDEGLALYRAVISDRGHVDAALNMMAKWDLRGLQAHLSEIAVPVLLMAAEADAAVPPSVSERAAARLPNASAVRLPGLGHLAHEEAPEPVADLILRYLADLRAPD